MTSVKRLLKHCWGKIVFKLLPRLLPSAIAHNFIAEIWMLCKVTAIMRTQVLLTYYTHPCWAFCVLYTLQWRVYWIDIWKIWDYGIIFFNFLLRPFGCSVSSLRTQKSLMFNSFQEATQQLDDTNFYKKIKTNPALEYNTKIKGAEAT